MGMECSAFIIFWSLLVTSRFFEVTAEPGGTVVFRLNSFKNLRNMNYNSRCCDGRSTGCQPCECKLEIWLTCDGKRNDTSCPYGHGKTGIFPITSEIIFNDTLGNGLKNPLPYNFSLFEGTFGIQVLATDGSNSKIDDFRYHMPLYPSIHSNKKWTNVTQNANGASGAILTMTYSVSCNPHYYGPACAVGCPPGKTYTCDKNTGRKVCIGAWLGPDCNCKQTIKNNCDISTGKKICYAPWYGENCEIKCLPKNDGFRGYSCNKSTGGKICLAGWHGSECNETKPVLPSTIRHISDPSSTRRIRFGSTILLLPTTSMTTKLHRPSYSPLCSSPSCYMTSSHATSAWSTSGQIRTNLPVKGITLSVGTLPKTHSRSTRLEVLHNSLVKLTISSAQSSVRRTDGTSVNNEEPTTPFKSLPQPAEPTQTVARHTSTENELLRVTQSIRREASLRIPTESSTERTRPAKRSEGLDRTETTKTPSEGGFTSVEEYPISQGSKTSSVMRIFPREITTLSPGSNEARKKREIWWMVLIPLLAALLFILCGLAALKQKERKRRKVSIQPDTALKKYKQYAESQMEKYKINDDNITTGEMTANDEKEDLKTGWKALSKYPELTTVYL